MHTLRHLVLCAILMTMAACGGGDPEPVDDKVPPPGPVDCSINPLLCR